MKERRLIKRNEYAEYLFNLFMKAFQKAPFEIICTLLRVSGIADKQWDPFEEGLIAFKDYNWLLKKSKHSPTPFGQWRMGLLMYCQAVEMSGFHRMLANCLRVLQGKRYHLNSTGHLGRANKKRPFSWIPPSATQKFNYLKGIAKECGEEKLVEYIDSFFLDDIRNAFSHSDYVLTKEFFRWTENGLAQQIDLKTLNLLIYNTREFYSAFWFCYEQLLKNFAHLPRYHKWPNYEILELLNDGEKLYGFHIHFSNGSKASFIRSKKGVDCVNVTIEKDGTMNFFVGLLDALEHVWKINGQTVTDWSSLNKKENKTPSLIIRNILKKFKKARMNSSVYN